MAKQVPARNGGTLTRPDKGESMNPKGRPKKLPEIAILIANALGSEKNGITVAEEILARLVKEAKAGNLKAAEMLLDRGYGKPTNKTEVTGKDGKDIGSFIIEIPTLNGDGAK